MRGRGGNLGKISDDSRSDLIEIINAGNANINHVAPEGAFVADHAFAAAQHFFFVIEMDAKFHLAGHAPVLHALVEIIAEHGAPDIPVVGLGPLRFGRHPATAENQGYVRFEIVTFHRLKCFEQFRRPRTDARVVGFVGAKAENGLAELITDRLFVGSVNEFQILVSRHGIKKVNQRIKAVLGGAAIYSIVIARGRSAESMPDESQLPSPRAGGGRPFEMPVSRQRHNGARLPFPAATASTATTTATAAATATPKENALGIRGHLNGERLPGRKVVAHFGAGQLNNKLSAAAPRHRIFEDSVSRHWELPARCRRCFRCRCCRRRHRSSRRIRCCCRRTGIGHNAERVRRQRNIECLAGSDNAVRI